ncbi:saccharopine dehydrogenase family protein [Streptomyces sp. NPDC057702]|uniref:saccharopine dehydrogenase family protein n=1 Tax=unclassified Streptomyces TaxID=2593676 RepID=UPI003680D092
MTGARPAPPRAYDLVLFGATGFTGALTASYLAAHAPAGLRWALAGRDPRRLAALRTELAAVDPRLATLPLLTADVTDPASLRALADRTRVLASTVGPYLRYGEPLVAACAAAGTDYADLTGEPEFTDRMYLRHHERARATGARLVHACGFDSIPPDLGVRYTVGLLPSGVPLRVDGYLRTRAAVSGGTLDSALTAASRPLAMARAARARRRLEPAPAGRVVRAPLGPPHRSRAVRAWALPLPTIDARIVARSAAASPAYGPAFRYRHFAAVRQLPVAAAGVLGVGALLALAQVPPARAWLTGRRGPGEGPSRERREASWFALRLVGQGGGRRVVTEVSGGDPGYDETARMLAESALCLALDDLPRTAGQVTPATAMGEALTARLVRSGLVFRVLSRE